MQRPCLSIRRINCTISRCTQRRNLLTLAIETSCDDTSVAILEKYKNNSATLHFHEKITSDNRSYQGVHPIVAHESHQKNLASLVAKALGSLPHSDRLAEGDMRGGVRTLGKPDFVTVTRGPGMRPSLTTGLDTAKGLAVAWQVPLVGINHMQAHALTPRLVSALDAAKTNTQDENELAYNPEFPFLSLLVSGGHTMLVHSRTLCEHEILANTTDIAIGDVIDKCARDILPLEYLASAKDVMYGPILESFAFPDTIPEYNYTPPKSFASPREVKGHDWLIHPPWSSPGDGGPISKSALFTFSGIGSITKRAMTNSEMDEAGRRLFAREAMAVAFEHLGSRVLYALERPEIQEVKTLVVSGGVASNQFLKVILRSLLDKKGYEHINLVFPPPKYCTDNAAMIAWTGMEMYGAGYRTSLGAYSIRKWSIDPNAEDGGILGADGWLKEAPLFRNDP